MREGPWTFGLAFTGKYILFCKTEWGAFEHIGTIDPLTGNEVAWDAHKLPGDGTGVYYEIRGITHDGEYLWAYVKKSYERDPNVGEILKDNRIVKFDIINGKEISSFDVPEGYGPGITNDGKNLRVLGNGKIYSISMTGNPQPVLPEVPNTVTAAHAGPDQTN